MAPPKTKDHAIAENLRASGLRSKKKNPTSQNEK
jgi:hypothetical protein